MDTDLPYVTQACRSAGAKAGLGMAPWVPNTGDKPTLSMQVFSDEKNKIWRTLHSTFSKIASKSALQFRIGYI